MRAYHISTMYAWDFFALFILCKEAKKNSISLQRNKENAKKILLIKITILFSILELWIKVVIHMPWNLWFLKKDFSVMLVLLLNCLKKVVLMGEMSKKWWFSRQNDPKMLIFKEYFSLLSLHPFLCEESSLQIFFSLRRIFSYSPV